MTTEMCYGYINEARRARNVEFIIIIERTKIQCTNNEILKLLTNQRNYQKRLN